MSADGFFASSDNALVTGVLDALRADPEVQALLGQPARIFDDETDAPVFPYAMLERHERFEAGSAGVNGAEHRLSLATWSRHGGRSEAKLILGTLRAAVDAMTVSLPGQTIILAHTVYSDAMRTRDRKAFRGVLRIRIITEEG